jgi:HPt (histidine-containing phosphotransfer) domain-containing protein
MIAQNLLSYKIERTEEEITPRSGLAIYAEFLRALKLDKLIAEQMPLPGSNRGYKAWQYIQPLMLMLYGGGRHIDDLREIRQDKALRTLVDLKHIPSASTVGDWLRRMGNTEGIKKLVNIEHSLVRELLLRDKNQEYTLYIDATVIEAEKDLAAITYKGIKGYQPILGGLKELPIVLEHEFRQGNEPAGARAVEFLEKCLAVLPAGKRIKHLSSDSAFYQSSVMNKCFEEGITFAIVADQDKAVKAAIRAIAEKEWKIFKDKSGRNTDREIAETVHTTNKTCQSFRLVVLRWSNPQLEIEQEQGYYYHVIATTLESSAEEVVWEYGERANFENYIKELKIGFGMEQLPSGDFGANAFWFLLGVLTYNTTIIQKLYLLPESWARKTIQTLRWTLVEIAGKIIRHGRQVILKLAISAQKYKIYMEMRRCCSQLA